ncbi:hypothetical protein P7K49_017670 [Saguinus oedipus]|uniref:Uncharacterized protein n=1 Tax=Saguinus oedipus TaxID=9490 RepID=A0ABQ9V368_SAGOE|nr:hypothetical protein P7K49_017670 [Saguinus oedipus]
MDGGILCSPGFSGPKSSSPDASLLFVFIPLSTENPVERPPPSPPALADKERTKTASSSTPNSPQASPGKWYLCGQGTSPNLHQQNRNRVWWQVLLFLHNLALNGEENRHGAGPR